MAGYIGSKASVVSSGAERKKTFAITTSTTSLTGLSYTPTKVHVFHNGVRLVDGTDYTATNGTSITLTSAAENGDQVVVVSYATFQTSDTVSASAGGTFAGNVAFGANATFGDNDKAIFGAGSDLQIYHDGVHSYVSDQGAGNIKILADDFILKNSADTETMIQAFTDASVSLWYDGSPRFATTSTGVDVTGTITSDGVSLDYNTGLFSTDKSLSSYSSINGVYLNGNSAGWLRLSGDGSQRSSLEITGSTFPAGEFARINVAGTERMRINSSGNVGIGTSSPSSFMAETDRLVIGSGSGNEGATIYSGSTSLGAIYYADGTTGDERYRGYTGYQHNGDYMYFGTATTERMRIDSSGNVGIGTSSPTQALVVSESSTPTIQIKDGAASGTRVSGRLHIGESDTLGVSIENSTSAYNDNCAMVFKTSPPAGTITERMRIDSSGNLLVGAAAFSGSSNCLQIESNGELDIGTNTTAGRYKIKFFNPNGFVGNIATNGSATQYNTSSDYRLKTDAQPMTGASARVQALNPVNFEWLSDGTRVDGFLAHEAQAVVPEAVHGTKDAMRDEEYEVTPAVYEDVVIPAVLDDDGNELEAERTEQQLVTDAVMGTRSVPDYQGIDQSKLVPLLTAALQEALNKIDTMETRLAALEGN